MCVPEDASQYNGQCVYRTIVSKSEVANINGIPWAPVFWKHASGLYVYTCPLGDDEFEVTARIRQSKALEDQVSWGKSFDLEKLLPMFTDFCPPVRNILELAAKGNTQEFALISGSRLHSMAFGGRIAFIGDAAHALCGNFGAGAGFAMEDVYTLARSLAWAYTSDHTIAEALTLYDSIRSPHYKRLYAQIDSFAEIKRSLSAECLPIDEDIEARVKRIAQASKTWMYYYDIVRDVNEEIDRADKSGSCSAQIRDSIRL